MPNPTGIFDLATWKATLPVGGKGKPTELSGADLVAYSSDWMKLLPAGGMQFRAPVNGVTTSGSGYPRSELREKNADGSLASWSSTDGKTHTLVVDEAVTRIPNRRTSGNAATVCAQIHDADNDISVFRVEDGKVWVTQGDTTHFALADGNYTPGTRFKAMFTVANRLVTAFYNGTKVCSFAAKGSGWYFKAGAYVQANCTNSSPCSVDNYGETVLHSVQVAHGGPVPVTPPVVTPPPTPVPDPPPVPVPTPSSADVVMIIRHGEKSSDKSIHTLDATGLKRAAALVDFFTKAPLKDGILTPQRIYASKGTSASMRPLQTVQPLAAKLGLTIDSHWDFETVESTVGKALAALHGVTLASAEHTAIPGVCKAFKLSKNSPKVPKAWPSALFSLVWKFTRQPDGTWMFQQITEGVLPGDPGYVVSPVAGFIAKVKQTLGIGV